MLVVTIKEGKSVMIGDNIVVTLCQVQGNKARIGIAAPPDVQIVREDAKCTKPKDRGNKRSPSDDR
ncbi:MAG: hypothetical protein KatS3mg109_0129 [Pirellulaceae bacterium]|nr:MAG: hypothetical protein KatS3mg109_0129 [Pirellulaceae bacterium]